MERKEAYAQIKKLGLEGEVKNKFGKNFTQISTADLKALIESKNVDNLRNTLENDENSNNNWEENYRKTVNAIARFLVSIPDEILNDAAQAAKTLTPETVVEEIEFSQDDIYKMFKK